MKTAASSQVTIYQDLGILLGAIVATLVVYFLMRLFIAKFFTAKGKGLRIFLGRLGLPGIFLITVFVLKKTLPVNLRFSPNLPIYLDAVLIFFIFVFIVRLFDAGLLVWYSRQRKPYPLPDVLRSLILAVIYVIVLFAVLKNMLQVNITPYLATSAILTMVLGLALQGVLSNILSGMSIQFTKSFSRGDWVGIGPHEGVVVDTNWRETRILDRYSNIIVLPNNTIASEKIINFSQPDNKTALTLPFKISYDAPVTGVLEALLEGARDCPDVLTAPSPQAYITSFDDFGVSYLLKFWVTDFANKNPIMGEVGRLAWHKMRRRNIEIALPLNEKAEELISSVKQGRGEPPTGIAAAEAREKEDTFTDLLDSSFLRYQQGEKAGQLMVPEDDVRELASVVHRAVYAAGEVLFRQGDKGRSCYIVARGKIRGEIIYEENGKKYVSDFRVGPGGIFGEMSLFTGMPRTATGVVEEQSVLLKIRAEDFAPLLARNPGLAEVIAEIVSARNEQNREFLVKIKELSEKDVRDSTNKKSILEYLKKFVHGLRR